MKSYLMSYIKNFQPLVAYFERKQVGVDYIVNIL
jgi:hypothetical protein